VQTGVKMQELAVSLSRNLVPVALLTVRAKWVIQIGLGGRDLSYTSATEPMGARLA
jgi:hypothetical protein